MKRKLIPASLKCAMAFAFCASSCTASRERLLAEMPTKPGKMTAATIADR